jgi:hypothetical protein
LLKVDARLEVLQLLLNLGYTRGHK